MNNAIPTNRTAVVIGASGGLGLALVRALSQRPGIGTVIALSRRHRDPASPSSRPAGKGDADAASNTTSSRPPVGRDSRIHWHQADATDPDQLAAAAERVATDHGGVHLLISCVGVLHGGREEPAFRPEKSLSALRLDKLKRSVEINAFAPLAALQAFLPLLRQGDGAVAAVLSAMVGSIGDNALGGWYSYRMSKAALNMGVRNAAIECSRLRDGPRVVAIHPGTTLTALSEPFVRRHAHRSPAESAERVLQVIESLSAEDTGKFFNWDGREIPW
jgi:NAD(P)-dependent dehydrogenase (short-subunit alcohol dehydrogenase family)